MTARTRALDLPSGPEVYRALIQAYEREVGRTVTPDEQGVLVHASARLTGGAS